MKKIIKYLKKIWFTKIKKERIYTVLVRGRIKEKNKNFLSLHGKKYIKKLKDFERFIVEKHTTPCVLEIGFGDGKHLAEKASTEKGKNFWGVELYSLGVILAAKKIFYADIKNVSLLETDARRVVEKSPLNFWQEIYVLFPDPWRKKKHFKRRILKEDFIISLIQKSSPGGVITLATDWESYREEIAESLQKVEQKIGKDFISLTSVLYTEKTEGEDVLILKTSFAERAFKEGRKITIFKIYKK